MKVYITVELPASEKDVPKIIGVYKKKSDAEKAAYSKEAKNWRNIIEQELK